MASRSDMAQRPYSPGVRCPSARLSALARVEVVAASGVDPDRMRTRSASSGDGVADHVHGRAVGVHDLDRRPRRATAGSARRGGRPRRRRRTRRCGCGRRSPRATSDRNALSPHCVSRWRPTQHRLGGEVDDPAADLAQRAGRHQRGGVARGGGCRRRRPSPSSTASSSRAICAGA